MLKRRLGKTDLMVSVIGFGGIKLPLVNKETSNKITADGFLILVEGSTSKPLNNLGTITFTDVTNHGKSYSDLSGVLTELWHGEPNISSADGATHTYTVHWNPSLLPELDEDEALNLTVYFLVTEEGV